MGPFRPDPACGIFETLLVTRGRPIELDAHMARVESSATELFGAVPPAGARTLVHHRARDLHLARLRLDVAPAGDQTLASETRVADVDGTLVFPSWERAVRLVPVEIPGGIGSHKWADRRLLELAEESCAPATPLIVDSDGALLEVSRGNVFLVRDGALITPRADGRILPGVVRRRIGDVAASAGVALREEAASVDDLAAADEVFVSGSVSGVAPVQACRTLGEWDEGPVTRSIARGLRRRWLDD